MAEEIVEGGAMWRLSYKGGNPRDTYDRKFAQAEALAASINGDEFLSLNETIQRNLCWLMQDLLAEAREALEECERVTQ